MSLRINDEAPDFSAETTQGTIHCAAKNPFHTTVSAVLSKFVTSPPLPPDAPGAFRFATPGKLANILAEAGATGIAERLLQFTLNASLSVEDFWTLRREMSDSPRAKMATLPPGQFAEVNRLALAAFRQYSTGNGISFPAEVLILSATKSCPSTSNLGMAVPA
jgi:hypothetical protein